MAENNNYFDNETKNIVRTHIVSIIEDKFKSSRKINMLELLGYGIGAKFYLSKLKKLKYLVAVDNVKNKCITVSDNLNDDKLFIIRDDIYNYTTYCNKKFDVINLDFCSWYIPIEQKATKSTYSIIKNVLHKKIFKTGSLIFCTFQLKSLNSNISEYRNHIVREPNLIVQNIIEQAANENILLEPLDEKIIYKSKEGVGASTMLTIGFMVK